MINVNILTRYNFPNFIHQLDNDRFNGKYAFYENSNLDIDWDLVVVYENISNLRSVRVKAGGLLFISGEPPISNAYSVPFLNQFDYLITCHPKLKHKNNILSQPSLNWHFGFDVNTNSYRYDFNALKTLPIPSKTRNISIISSSKKMMPGHCLRLEVIRRLVHTFPDEIDVYGEGINPIVDKADAILPYRFNICIENSFIDDYWSEKFADPILGYSIPIYSGCTNINRYFNQDFYFNFDIHNINQIIDFISSILTDPDWYYKSKLESLIRAREKLLNDYNIFPVLANHLKLIKNNNNKVIQKTIVPNDRFFSYKKELSLLRMRRFIYKQYIIFKNYVEK